MSDLMELPEIGAVTAKQLSAVGLGDAEALRAAGAEEAFLRIRDELDPGACVRLFTGLDCAVRGISSKELTPEEKAELRARFRALACRRRSRAGVRVDQAGVHQALPPVDPRRE